MSHSESEGYSGLLRSVAVLLRHRAVLTVIPTLLAVLVVGVGLLRARTYTSTAAFVPEARGSLPAGVAGLAAQFGVALPGGEAGESPAFYADLLLAHHSLVHLADYAYRWSDKGTPVTGTLADAFGLGGDGHSQRIEFAVRDLEQRLSVRTNMKTGVITLRVRTKWPELSHAILLRALAYVDEFNLKSRQTRAAAERQFVGERLGSAGEQLRSAEDRLERFLQRNREFQTSPSLKFEFDRLGREVLVAQQVVTTLSEASERAKIEAVRNTPTVTVVEPPTLAVLPDSRRLAIKGLLALVVGGGIALALVLTRQGMIRTRVTTPEVVAEVSALRAEVLRDLRRPWRLFGIRRPER